MDFFRRTAKSDSAAALGGSSSASHHHVQVVALEQQLLELQVEERRYRERCQNLEVERSLLQNLVDRLYSDSNDNDGTSTAPPLPALSTFVQQIAELTSTNTAQRGELEELRREATATAKRIAAYEAALENTNSELRTSDAELHVHREVAATCAALEAEMVTMRQQATDREETISALLGRVADRDRHIKDVETILRKNVESQDAVTEELSVQSGRVLHLQDELRRERDARLHAEAELLRWQTGPPTLESHSEAAFPTAHQLDDVTAAEAQPAPAPSLAVTALMDAVATSFMSLMELHMACTTQMVAAALPLFVEAHADMIRECDSVRVALMAELTESRREIGVLQERVAVKEARIIEARAFLQQSEERQRELEGECQQTSLKMEELQLLLEDARGKEASLQQCVVEKDEVIAALEAQSQALEEQLAVEQRLTTVRARQTASVIKDLKDQLDAAGSHTTSTQKGQEADVDQLLKRLADAQERIWLLETAKVSYEREIGRLTESAERHHRIVQLHFREAAEKFAKRQGKLGAGLFQRTEAELSAQAYALVEDVLAQNVALRAEMHALRDTNRSGDQGGCEESSESM